MQSQPPMCVNKLSVRNKNYNYFLLKLKSPQLHFAKRNQVNKKYFVNECMPCHNHHNDSGLFKFNVRDVSIEVTIPPLYTN